MVGHGGQLLAVLDQINNVATIKPSLPDSENHCTSKPTTKPEQTPKKLRPTNQGITSTNQQRITP